MIPRCEIIPDANQEVSVRIAGRECLRWHASDRSPRPFFYPLTGPSGESLTRIGHPGAPNHDHHRSVWFAHNKVLGMDFWSDTSEPFIRQTDWLVYADGDDAAAMAVRLGWFDGHDPAPILTQDMVALIRPRESGEFLLELQSTFRPASETLEFGQTNYGFLAIRVAKSISVHFGGGQLRDSEGRVGESQIFGKRAAWMDYSGPVPSGIGATRNSTVEGITCFDHPSNPSYPTHWHVREDGWMGASVGMQAPVTTTRSDPLKLRYMLHIHGGDYEESRAKSLAQEFRLFPEYAVQRSTKPHRQFELVEID